MRRNELFRPTVSPRVHLALLGAIVLACSLPLLALRVHAQQAPEYLSPRPGAVLVSPGTTIAVRYGPTIDAASVRDGQFQVEGSQSGRHTGRVILSDDHRTVIFRPYLPFAPAEKVTVNLSTGLRSTAVESLGAVSFEFHISPQAASQKPLPISDLLATETNSAPAQAQAPSTNQIVSNFLTLPADFPNYTVTVAANGTGEGYVFVAPFRLGPTSTLMILDNTGQPVYYLQSPASIIDFKRQPNGWLTYFDSNVGYYIALDNSYNVVNTYQAGNGYNIDFHELQLIPNGDALLMIYDPQTVDMRPAGWQTATVIGLVVQELDTAKNVVFEWRSWDHFLITDTFAYLGDPTVDYVHGNAIELDQDDNLMISSRHLSEVTKIDRQTGDIIWRLGGKNNQFTPVPTDTQPFAYQHDIRRLPNGNITLWDNRNFLPPPPPFSRAREYQLDEVNKTVTQVWEYRNTPDAFSAFMGSAQRLPNGNTLLGWGGVSSPAVIEVKPDNSKAFELSLEPTWFSYRAFRFPWQGFPTSDPTLVVKATGATTTLAYSWNGATEIGSYRIYGGDSDYPSTLLAVQPKTGFEDKTVLVGLQGLHCYFRVMPIDKSGRETRYSNEAHLTPPCQPQKKYFPLVGK